MTYIFRCLAFALNLLGVGAIALSHQSSQWVSLPNITVGARQEHATFFLPPSTIGIVGGIFTNLSTTGMMQFYSLDKQSWETKASVPVPLNHINTAVNNGLIYVLGGLVTAPNNTAWEAFAGSWVYNPDNDAWKSIPPMSNDDARGSAAMGVYQDKIFLAGGLKLLELTANGSQITVDTVSAFDTTNGKWIDLPEAAKKLPDGRDHSGAAVIGDKMYVVGGRRNGQQNVKDTVFILDLCDLESGWKTSNARMPTPRGGLSAGVVGNKVYTFGGEGDLSVPSGVYNETEVYDTVTDSWQKLASMRVPRHGTSAVGVGNKVYIPGGGVLIGAGPVATFDAFET